MVLKNHTDLLRDIRRYADYLNESKIALVEFFQESTYQYTKGETRPCYHITKKGCEMIANKLTGKKGILFTAAYVTKLNDMERAIQSPPVLPVNTQAPKTRRISVFDMKTLGDAFPPKDELIATAKRSHALSRCKALLGTINGIAKMFCIKAENPEGVRDFILTVFNAGLITGVRQERNNAQRRLLA